MPTSPVVPPPLAGLIGNRTINLIIGSPTSGKTVLALSELERYQAGGGMFGFLQRSGQPPAQCAMACCTETLTEVHDRLTDMRLRYCNDPVGFPITDWHAGSSETVLDTITRIHGELSRTARQPVRLLLLEGIQKSMGNGRYNDPFAVNEFYEQLKRFSLDSNCAILGTIGQAKMKAGDRYPLLADRILGSVAWASGASRLIGIEPIMLHVPEGRRPTVRKITVQPARGRGSEFYMDFTEDGRLERVDWGAESTESPSYLKLDALLDSMDPTKPMTREEWVQAGEQVEISRSTVDRWLAIRSSDEVGMLEKVGSGNQTRRYRKPFRN